jgi:hypothetical protein
MNTTAKVLVPNKVWILEKQGVKLGTLNKEKKGYAFFRNGDKVELHDINEVRSRFGEELFKDSIANLKSSVKSADTKSIYDFPCSSRPYNPVYNVKNRLPIYAKSNKSKSLYCAGYYVIQFRKGWVKSFCPKLITLERYPYHGPFKTEQEMKTVLNQVNKL